MFRTDLCVLMYGTVNGKEHTIVCVVLLYPPFCISIGGESLAVAQNTYAVNWFKGKELNLVFGLQLSMARLVRTLPMKQGSYS